MIQISLQRGEVRVRSGGCGEGNEQLPGVLLIEAEPAQRAVMVAVMALFYTRMVK